LEVFSIVEQKYFASTLTNETDEQTTQNVKQAIKTNQKYNNSSSNNYKNNNNNTNNNSTNAKAPYLRESSSLRPSVPSPRPHPHLHPPAPRREKASQSHRRRRNVSSQAIPSLYLSHVPLLRLLSSQRYSKGLNS
jgi:hypothetical protein